MSILEISRYRDVNKDYEQTTVNGNADGEYAYLYMIEPGDIFTGARLVAEGITPFVHKMRVYDDPCYIYVATKKKYNANDITSLIPTRFWYTNTTKEGPCGTRSPSGYLPGDNVEIYSRTECTSSSDSCHHTTGAWYAIDGVIKGGNTYHNHSGSYSVEFTIPNDNIYHDIRYSLSDNEPTSIDEMIPLTQNRLFDPYNDDPLWKIENGILKPNVDTTELESLRKQVNELKAENDKLKSDLKTANDTISNLESLKNDLTSFQQEINDLLEQLKYYEELLLVKDEEIRNLNKRINDLEIIISNYETQISQLNKELTNLNKKLDDLYIENNKLEEENEKLKSNNNKLNNDLLIANQTISILEEQISNSTGNSSLLAEKLANAQKELNKLENEIMNKLEKMESLLNETNKGMNENANEIIKMQKSLVPDINSSLGTPRFGIMPLPIGKQALAVNSELLQDCSTGHLYIKNGNKLVSKTVDIEEMLYDIEEIIKTYMFTISINFTNYFNFINDGGLFVNADKSISSKKNIIEFKNLIINYSDLVMYKVAIETNVKNIKRVFFKDLNGNTYEFKASNSNTTECLFELESGIELGKEVYPVIELMNTNNSIKNILIYTNEKLKTSKTNDININNSGDLDIDSITIYDKEKDQFTLNKNHPIKIYIPKNSLRSGRYSILLRLMKNVSVKLNVKGYFNNALQNKSIDFSKIGNLTDGKTGFTTLDIPKLTTDVNYIEVSTDSQTDIIVQFILINLLDSDVYLKDEISNLLKSLNTEIENKLKTINNNITTLQNNVQVLQNGNMLKVSSSDPGNSIKVNDVWLDTTNNVFKRKTRSGYVITGAKYNNR